MTEKQKILDEAESSCQIVTIVRNKKKMKCEGVQLRRFDIAVATFFYIPIIPDMPLLAYAIGLMSG
jgi:hypothetical protein